MTKPIPVVKGTLDALVLKALADGPKHGFEITTWLAERSRQQIELTDSALYQALYRMEAKNLIGASWGVTENNRRARYYTIKTTGRRQLEAETERWIRYGETITAILTATPAPAARPR